MESRSSEQTAADALLEAYQASHATSSRAAAMAERETQTGQDPLITLRDQLRDVQAKLDETQRMTDRLSSYRAGSSRGHQVHVPFPADASKQLSTKRSGKMIPAAFFSGNVMRQGKVSLPSFSSESQHDPQSFPTYEAAIANLSKRRAGLTAKRESIRKEVLALASEAVQQRLGFKPGSVQSANGMVGRVDDQMNERGEILNEEGLPFFEPVEKLSEPLTSEKGRPRARDIIAPFKPKPLTSPADRKKWMDSVFDQLEDEDEACIASGSLDDEDKSGNDAGTWNSEENTVSAMGPAREHSSRREGAHMPSIGPSSTSSEPVTIPSPLPQSSERPRPAKPALKKSHSSPGTPNPPFGAAGFKRGFLNLNPSSPAAEHSSDYVECGFVEAMRTLALERVEAADAGSEDDKKLAEDDQMSRVQEQHSPSGARGKGKRKSVRIQSPERVPHKSREEAIMQYSSRSQNRPTDEDEGVEEEARRIVELLGPGVVSTDLPGMAGTSTNSSLSAGRRQRDVAQRASSGVPEGRLVPPSKPVINRTVVERTPASAAATFRASPNNEAVAKAAKTSTFARGFLNQKPGSAMQADSSMCSSAQHDPRTSLGISATEHASRADKPLERERKTQGLTPAAPHARPSKAYAEKIREKQAAQRGGEDRGNVGSTDVESHAKGVPNGSSAVCVGGEMVVGDDRLEGSSTVRFGSVSVGEAVTEARFYADVGDKDTESSEDEEEMVDFDRDSDDGDEGEEEGVAFDHDDEDSYDSDDLADLQPDFDSDLDWDADMLMADLQREYSLAKASLLANQGEHAEALHKRNQHAVAEGEELVPNDHVEGEDGIGVGASESKPKASRFKQDRMARAFGTLAQAQTRKLHQQQQQPEERQAQKQWGIPDADEAADAAGHDLVHLLRDAQNLGPVGQLPDGADVDMREPQHDQRQQHGATIAGRPVMVIPQLAPVRFAPGGAPVTEQMLRSRQGVELEGESDEDDARLFEIARRRLGFGATAEEGEVSDEHEEPAKEAHARKAQTAAAGSVVERGRPPVVRARTAQRRGASPPVPQGAQDVGSPPPPKKVSRFKAARMGG